MSALYVISKSKDNQFYFNLQAPNGEKILTSELYKEKASAITGIEAVKKNSVLDDRYVRKLDDKKQPFFVLKAMNNEIIGKSESYSSNPAMENGIRSVKTNGPIASIDDRS